MAFDPASRMGLHRQHKCENRVPRDPTLDRRGKTPGEQDHFFPPFKLYNQELWKAELRGEGVGWMQINTGPK